ncbi:ABC transporter substrate-binding protein [uncultured Anaerotruncus sp.]|uniref:ABC transporter substrate-binding protein n=1 Tax=uncultured Anaerotruncus sp. TaxID=905011 RepID=UPI00280A92FB|nr:ABC transporter substrate-binding protein [uncultured Anaerotruncus sp.]
MSKVKRVLSILTAILMLVGLAACGGEGSQSVVDSSPSQAVSTADSLEASPAIEPVTLTYWNSFTAEDGEILTDIVNKFNASNDYGITIEMDIMPLDNLSNKLALGFASGTAPDFFTITSDYFASYASEGFVTDLSPFFSYDGVDKDDISEGALNIAQVDGKQYFLPKTINSFFLYWNKDLFEAAGLDPEKGPETWEELEEYAVRLTDPANNISGFGVPARSGGAFNIIGNWMLSYGGGVLNEDQTQSVLNSPENLAVMTHMQNLIHTEKTGPEGTTLDELMQMMIGGNLAMTINGPWANGGLANNEINYGITAIPHAEGLKPAAYGDATGFAIPSSTDASKHAAIYEFIKYWYSAESYSNWVTSAMSIPLTKSVMEIDEVKNNPILTAMGGQASYAQAILPGNPQASVIIDDVVLPMVESIQMGADPATALEEADAVLQGMV